MRDATTHHLLSSTNLAAVALEALRMEVGIVGLDNLVEDGLLAVVALGGHAGLSVCVCGENVMW